jgi:hypothetical protein
MKGMGKFMPADIQELNDKTLATLPPDGLAGQLMRLPAKKRLELILDRPDSEAVVAAMDVNDFFFTVQEIGGDDSLPLLAMGRPDQLNHLFDIEWWRKDTMEPARALAWIDRLARAGARKLLEWLHQADFELLVSLFSHWINVSTAPEDVDLVEARETLPPHTLDDVYFWESKYPQFEDLIGQLLTLLFEVNYGFFRELMNHVLYAPGPDFEEQAYRFHRARLEDNAVPAYYDALEIYRAVHPGKLRVKKYFGSEDSGHAAPSFALALVRDGDLLGRVLHRITDPQLVRTLQLELASLANKVVVADQLPTDSAHALRQAAGKALAYVNLGLEIRSGGGPAEAEAALKELFLEDVFRIAHAEVAGVAGGLCRMVKFGWLAACPGKVKCLDAPWFDAAEKLLESTPRLLRPKDYPGPSPIGGDFFRTPEDLARGARIVSVIEAAGELYRALGPGLWPEAQVRTVEDITVGVMVLTAAARMTAEGKFRCAPLPVRGWPEMFPLLDRSELGRVIGQWMEEAIPDPQKRRLAADYLEPVLADYEAEIRPFSETNPPEARLVRFFMFENR